MRPASSAVCATVVLAGLLVGGCGGESKKDALAKDYRPINAQIVALGVQVGDAIQSAPRTPDAAIATRFLGFVPKLQALKARVDKLHPTSDLTATRQRLSRGLSQLVVDLGGIGLAARAHDKDSFRRAVEALLRDSPPMASARRELARKVGVPESPTPSSG